MEIYDVDNQQNIINSFNDIVIVTDLNDVIRSYNRRAYKFFSFDKDFLMGKNIRSFMESFEININGQFVSGSIFDLNNAMRNDISEDIRTIVLRRVFKRKELFFKLGVYKHKISNMEIIGNIYILTDVTNIYTAYRDLNKANEMMKGYLIEMKGIMDIKQRKSLKKEDQFIHINNIINNLREGIIVVDNVFSEIYCNEAFRNTFDFTVREFLSLKFLDSYKVEDITGDNIDIREFLKNIRGKNGKRSGQFLFKNIVCNIEKYFQITIDTIYYHDNSKEIKYHNVITFSDITQIKKQELLKDDFFNMVSHELRTPITLIKSSLQALENICKEEITPNMKKYLNMMNKNSSRLLKLINNILDLSKAESGYMAPVMSYFDIVLVTEDIVTSINVHANHKKNIQVIFEPNVEEAYLRFDKEMYEKILLNILSNAIKFTPNNKKVYVNLIVNSKNFVLKIKDQGIGIPKDKLNDIFNKFSQVNSILSRGAEGTGIGLSLVKKFVDILNGKITLKSNMGIGTEFILTFDRSIENSDFNTFNEDIVINDDVNGKVDIHFSDIYP